MKIETTINRIIKNYSDKPKFCIVKNGTATEIHLHGGNYQARKDVEDYFTKRKQVEFVNNQPESKIIGFN